MASSNTNTPKTNLFATPRKIGAMRTQLHAENLFKTCTTPKSSQKLQSNVQTPDCLNSGTPTTQSKRRSSEKYDQISNLTVAVRVRPMNAKELACTTAANCVSIKDNQLIITSKQAGTSTLNIDHIFYYDHIFWSCDETNPLYASQEDVFYTIGIPLLNSAFRGYNACLFAYGQTGSGKSFSMMGRNTTETIDIDSEQYSGIVPRFCRHLFERIDKLEPDSATVEVCYFEIYNEKIHDLLATNRLPLKVREHPEWGPYVVDLTVHPVKSYTELRNWLLIGNQNRATAATNMNEKSSRSHSIFTIELCLIDDEKSSRRSRVSLVDLAGSERLGGGIQNTDEKIRQGVCINKSLLTLGKVISSLAETKRNQFIPYRDSVLTWLLKESLGGNSLTSMLATITPSNTNLDETLATLRYACQARSIVNRARINESPHDRVIRELKQEVERLKALKQDYERNSFTINNSLSPTSISAQLDDDSRTRQELEELRTKLQAAESKLLGAEENWRQRFFENAQNQLKELAESEKRREELESKVRILKTIDNNSLNMSVYKTNFLQELEDVLTDQHVDETSEIERIIDWCFKNNLKCLRTDTVLTIIDNNRQTFLLLKDVGRLNDYENIADFIASLTWTETKRLTKSDILSNFNQIYQALNNLKANIDDENGLNLIFAKVNKSLQSFETALLNNLTKNGKNVTFKV